jgi:hypothetical protein
MSEGDGAAWRVEIIMADPNAIPMASGILSRAITPLLARF